VKLLLIKQLVGESNRMFANMLTVFPMISDIDVSCRAVERPCSGPEVILAIRSLHALILSKKEGSKGIRCNRRRHRLFPDHKEEL